VRPRADRVSNASRHAVRTPLAAHFAKSCAAAASCDPARQIGKSLLDFLPFPVAQALLLEWIELFDALGGHGVTPKTTLHRLPLPRFYLKTAIGYADGRGENHNQESCLA
jgi:hypothetical protein